MDRVETGHPSHGWAADGNGSKPEGEALCVSAPDWMERTLPPRDFLVGEFLSTTSRVLFAADTGLGKTMIGLALAVALATGTDLLHWKVPRPRRVLYVDGEMPRELIKERLIDAVDRIKCARDAMRHLSILSTEDAKDLPPLNTTEGQAWLDNFIEQHGSFDLILFDNIAALTLGDMRDEESWRGVEPWMQSLTKRRIGQIWLHHTGHDGGRSYGSKVREWKMDCVLLGERIEEQGADVAMRCTFKKARTRTPSNRADFEPFDLRLMDGQWTAIPVSKPAKSEPKGTRVALDTLREAIDASGKPIPANSGAPTNRKGVMLETWRDFYQRRVPLDCGEDDQDARGKAIEARKKSFQRERRHLQEAGIIQAANDWFWLI